MFVLIPYAFFKQIMLILILIDVQYSQKAVCRFEKGSNSQNHFSLGPHHLVKEMPPPEKFASSPSSLNTIWKTQYNFVL